MQVDAYNAFLLGIGAMVLLASLLRASAVTRLRCTERFASVTTGGVLETAAMPMMPLAVALRPAAVSNCVLASAKSLVTALVPLPTTVWPVVEADEVGV